MKIGITGGTGLIGTRLSELATEAGHAVVIFSRRPAPAHPTGIEFRPLPDPAAPDLAGCDALVNLAGESILGLWTAAKKARILGSRVEVTRRLVASIAASPTRPRVLVNASAVGFYGSRGDEPLDEDSAPGTGFLADTAVAWEAEAVKAEALGVRVARVRIGFALSPKALAVGLMLPASRLALGGRLGSGKQWMASVHVDDVAGAFLAAATDPALSGPINAVFPEPSTNAEFTAQLARIVRRPAIFPVPAAVLKIGLGELSGLLLDSQRVRPAKLLASGYRFRFPTLRDALADCVG